MKTQTEIHYMLVDPGAAGDGVPSVTTKQPWVNVSQLHDEDDTHVMAKWGTLEPGQFVLDGTAAMFPDDPAAQDMGLWSAGMSGADGRFAAPPVLTVAFSRPHTSLGITFVFAEPTGDWCDDLHLAWYDAAGAVLAEQNFAPDSASYFCDRLVHDYYKVVATFRKTNKPRRYLKLFRVRYGVVEHLTGGGLTEASLLEEADPTSMTVSVNTLRFGFYADRRFDLLDLTGVYSVFQQQQRVRVRQTVDGVTREMGLFYTDVPEVQDERVVTIDCIDLVGVLGQTEYLGGLWLDGITAGALIREIMTSADAAAYYELAPSLAGIVIKGYLPICTHREALQQVAFALGAVVSCARSDNIRIYPLPPATSTITPHDKAAGHRQVQRGYVSGVEVYTHHYVPARDVTELFKATCKAGTEFVRFSSPAASLSCSGASIVESGVNYAKLNVPAAGQVVLSGKPYDDQTSLGGSVYAAVMPAGARASVKTVEGCTLTADPQAVAQGLYDFYQQRIEDTGDLFPVDAAAGEVVRVETAGSHTLTGMVESLDIDLLGGGIAKAVVAGG